MPARRLYTIVALGPTRSRIETGRAVIPKRAAVDLAEATGRAARISSWSPALVRVYLPIDAPSFEAEALRDEVRAFLKTEFAARNSDPWIGTRANRLLMAVLPGGNKRKGDRGGRHFRCEVIGPAQPARWPLSSVQLVGRRAWSNTKLARLTSGGGPRVPQILVGQSTKLSTANCFDQPRP